LRCLMVLARLGGEGPVSIRRIVEDENLPQDYIEQLLLKLRRGKLIKSARGVNGGYQLIRVAADISVRDVLEAVEGHTFELICGRENKPHKRPCCDESCVLRGVWKGLKGLIEDYLDRISVQDLIDKDSGGKG